VSLVRLRGGSELEWETANPVLASREVGVVPAGGAKVGDGVTAWTSLPWVGEQGGDTAVADAGDAATVAWTVTWDGGSDLTVGADAGTSEYVFWDAEWDAGDATTSSWAGGTADGGVASGSTTPVTPDLTVDGGDAGTIWGLLSTIRTLTTITGTYSVTEFDHIILANGTFTVTLPSVAEAETGREFTVKNTGTGLVTVDPSGSETIDGSTLQPLSQYESLTIINTGTDWAII
jgi:hypothetical protein